MRADAFTSTERGRVRKAPEGYWAFHPTEAPRRLSLSEEVIKLLDEATGAVQRLGGVGRLIPNPHLLIGPHLRLEAVLNRPGSDGGSFYWIPTPVGSVWWAA